MTTLPPNTTIICDNPDTHQQHAREDALDKRITVARELEARIEQLVRDCQAQHIVVRASDVKHRQIPSPRTLYVPSAYVTMSTRLGLRGECLGLLAILEACLGTGVMSDMNASFTVKELHSLLNNIAVETYYNSTEDVTEIGMVRNAQLPNPQYRTLLKYSEEVVEEYIAAAIACRPPLGAASKSPGTGQHTRVPRVPSPQEEVRNLSH